MSAAFTPGPWTCFYKAKYDEWHVSVPVNRETAMRLALFPNGMPTERPEADAHLIAAAPDLLRALEFALRDMEATRVQFASHAPNVGVLAVSIAVAHAAIAKARGQS